MSSLIITKAASNELLRQSIYRGTPGKIFLYLQHDNLDVGWMFLRVNVWKESGIPLVRTDGLTVYAPDSQKSAVGHSITISKPLFIDRIIRENGFSGFSVSGSPADCVKIGIGAGSSCTTRIIAGVGVPQLSAVMDCAQVGLKHNTPIIADGGIRYSGDIAKSLAAGANVVMLGGMLAGMDESPGETIVYEGRRYKSYRGMGSLAAMKEGGGERYFQQEKDELKLVPEGIEGMVPFRGPVNNTIFQLIGGLKSSMGYCGAKDLKSFFKHKKFIEISAAGIKESHPHEVSIIKEAPNYQGHDK